MPLLPQEVQRQGVNVSKATSSFLQVVGFVSPDGSMDRVDLTDYVSTNLVDPLSRVPGVGNIQVFGGKYAMRIWLDQDKQIGRATRRARGRQSVEKRVVAVTSKKK